jgi:hydroxymethylglutaryl-CoA lyase
MNYPSLVSLREVAPRDGWQKFKTVLPTEVKRELICSMIDYGARELEIGVFSSDPVRGRQYQDLEPLCQAVLPYAAERGVKVTALVESVEAAQRARALGIRHVDFFLSVSDAFGSTPDRAFATLEAIANLPDLQVQAALGAVFGCPFGDATPLEKTLAYAQRAMELGASSLGLGDSAGKADPIHTERILRGILERFRPEQISLHIHNTEGFGLANCVKAMELGFTRFDVSLAGMGGCPVIPNAKGNIPTEDFVNLLHKMDIGCGIDLDRCTVASLDMSRRIGAPVISSMAGNTLLKQDASPLPVK